MKKKQIEDFVSIQLKEKTFEDLLEDFDLTPEQVFWILYSNGQIDDEVLESQYDPYEY